ncbi:MAG: polysaccharide deacetylase family protein [Candidatus Schekmanbacteria bacterium]|nr:MAG: polysaccharide deacetylase family protein [Candidatus Schekmanbacteria bacterium]
MMIPVLTYHSISQYSKITPTCFEEHLKFLLNSGYSFRFASELPEKINNAKATSKEIAMTIDDGYYDVYEYVFPLIKKYGVKITVFLITSRIGNHDGEVLDAHKAHQQYIEKQKKSGFLNIDNIIEMQKSGIVEFQSHSHSHLLHYSNNKIHSFYNPDFIHHWSLPYAANHYLVTGMPLYRLYPSLAFKRFLPSKKSLRRVSEKCKEILAEKNLPSNWEKVEKKLHIFCKREKNNYLSDDESMESESNYIKRIKNDLKRSKELIEEIVSARVELMSLPWGVYNSALLQIAEEVGYKLAFSLESKRKTSFLYPRIVINKGNIQELEKRLSPINGFFKKVSYFFIDSQKNYWSPQKEKKEN